MRPRPTEDAARGRIQVFRQETANLRETRVTPCAGPAAGPLRLVSQPPWSACRWKPARPCPRAPTCRTVLRPFRTWTFAHSRRPQGRGLQGRRPGGVCSRRRGSCPHPRVFAPTSSLLSPTGDTEADPQRWPPSRRLHHLPHLFLRLCLHVRSVSPVILIPPGSFWWTSVSLPDGVCSVVLTFPRGCLPPQGVLAHRSARPHVCALGGEPGRVCKQDGGRPQTPPSRQCRRQTGEGISKSPTLSDRASPNSACGACRP